MIGKYSTKGRHNEMSQRISCFTLSPFHQHGITLIPTWISNRNHYKVWVKLVIHSQTSTVQPLKFVNGSVIYPIFYQTCDCLSMLWLKLNHVSKRGYSFVYLPGIVLSSTNPISPPTNILVVAKTVKIWSASDEPANDIKMLSYTQAWSKWSTICVRHFQMCFIEWKFV